MDKTALLEAIVAYFKGEHQVIVDSARAIYEAATHEDARAENKYDTRGLEASYMAESQSKRALELQQTVNIYRAMEPRIFSDDDTIAMGAVVVLENEATESQCCFLGPRGGGAKIPFEDGQVMVITAASPLGKALMGKEVGDELEIGEGRHRHTWFVEKIF